MKVILLVKLVDQALGFGMAELYRQMSDHMDEIVPQEQSLDDDSPFKDLHEGHQRDFGVLDEMANRMIRRNIIEVSN